MEIGNGKREIQAGCIPRNRSWIVSAAAIRSSTNLYYYPGDHATVGEPIFVPGDENAPEGHRYVFVIVSRRDAMRSELVILDAQRVDGEPVCTLNIPLRIPRGLHGNEGVSDKAPALWVSVDSAG